jgi:hypothetical protein
LRYPLRFPQNRFAPLDVKNGSTGIRHFIGYGINILKIKVLNGTVLSAANPRAFSLAKHDIVKDNVPYKAACRHLFFTNTGNDVKGSSCPYLYIGANNIFNARYFLGASAPFTVDLKARQIGRLNVKIAQHTVSYQSRADADPYAVIAMGVDHTVGYCDPFAYVSLFQQSLARGAKGDTVITNVDQTVAHRNTRASVNVNAVICPTGSCPLDSKSVNHNVLTSV